ncbi:tRNA preQ1(34) S-adenosylmethionine ribosyltransferase-isomerase QueA [Candidatus Omnitrophota bacterium]
MKFKLTQFEFSLPRQLIAQEPVAHRDESRILLINRKKKSLQEAVFKDIVKSIKRSDLLVLNNTRVLPAKLFARRKTGGKLEILLLKEKDPETWEALVKPAKKALPGEKISFAEGRFSAEIQAKTPCGGRLIRFSAADIQDLMHQYGSMPLPHYIKKELRQPDAYQTVYAQKEGAVAAPTAGLHFTKELLARLISSGTEIVYITLHCGLATFRPVKTADIRAHRMESEFYEIDSHSCHSINRAKVQGRRIIAVGTTVARALEAASFKNQHGPYQVRPGQAETGLYIYPGYKFKMVEALLTNFHLPHSTNLIMVSAFAGIGLVRKAYQYAMKKNFRFYSFGDATLII